MSSWRVLHQIRQKSGGRCPNKHSWSAYTLLIRWWPEHFNSQLKFARRSADVPTIHSSFGHLAVSARRPKGHRRNYLLCRPNDHRRDAIRTPVGDRSIICRFAPSNCWLLRDRWVIERCPCDHPAVIHGVSPWMCCACVLCCYMYYMFIKYIEWYCIKININYWLC